MKLIGLTEIMVCETKEFYFKINPIIADHVTKHLSAFHGSIVVGGA